MTFFDTREPFARRDVAELDRIYRFAWDAFTQADWDRLAAVYRKLPNWIDDDDGPRWFGADDGFPHLTASVEPPGLQVAGVVPAADFVRWHDAFMELLGDFPVAESNERDDSIVHESHESTGGMPTDLDDKLAVIHRQRLERASRVRNVYGVVALCALVFAVIHSGDGDALQWPSALVLVLALFLYLTSALWAWSVRHRR